MTLSKPRISRRQALAVFCEVDGEVLDLSESGGIELLSNAVWGGDHNTVLKERKRVAEMASIDSSRKIRSMA